VDAGVVLLVGRMTRPSYQVRVIAERDRLADDLEKLNAFIASPSFRDGVGQAERDRLVRQSTHMAFYLDVLDERIAAFEN
jgi:hypothetical protein